MYKTKIKVFVSNRGILLEEKLNNELDKLEKEGCFIKNVSTDISYSGSTGYQAMGTIIYEEYIEDGQLDIDDSYSIHFNSGELIPSFTDNETTRSDAH